MVAKSIAKIYTNIHKPTDYRSRLVQKSRDNIAVTPQFNLSFSFVSRFSKHLIEFIAIE